GRRGENGKPPTNRVIDGVLQFLGLLPLRRLGQSFLRRRAVAPRRHPVEQGGEVAGGRLVAIGPHGVLAGWVECELSSTRNSFLLRWTWLIAVPAGIDSKSEISS